MAITSSVIQMIARAMRLAGAIGVGETPSDQEAADGLEALQHMIDSWNTERLFAYCIIDESLTLNGSQQDYTIGPSGDLNTTRPVRIDNSSYIQFQGISFPLQIVEVQAWDSIPAKSTQSNIPWVMYVKYGYPLITVRFYTYPTSAGAVAHITSWQQLQAFTSLTDELSMPPGTARAIVYSLAEEFGGPEFGLTISPDVHRIATKARANLKRVNAPMRVARLEVGYMNRMRGANIYQGN